MNKSRGKADLPARPGCQYLVGIISQRVHVSHLALRQEVNLILPHSGQSDNVDLVMSPYDLSRGKTIALSQQRNPLSPAIACAMPSLIFFRFLVRITRWRKELRRSRRENPNSFCPASEVRSARPTSARILSFSPARADPLCRSILSSSPTSAEHSFFFSLRSNWKERTSGGDNHPAIHLVVLVKCLSFQALS